MMKYYSAAGIPPAYKCSFPDVRKHVCLVQTPETSRHQMFWSLFRENVNCDAKGIIPTNYEAYQNRPNKFLPYSAALL